MVTGISGIWLRMAILAAPRESGASPPGGERVPSGNTTSLQGFDKRATQVSITSAG